MCGSAHTDTQQNSQRSARQNLQMDIFSSGEEACFYNKFYTHLQGPPVGKADLWQHSESNMIMQTDLKAKVKYLRGAFWQSQSLSWPYFPCPWNQVVALCRWAAQPLSYIPLFGLALTNTMDYLSEMCLLKLTDFCLFCYNWLYTILQGPVIHPMTQYLSGPGINHATLRWENQYSKHAVNLTCLCKLT